MPRALLSVTDKSGLAEFGQGLTQLGFTLLSTGGTAKVLRDAGLTVIDVSEVTGFPEMLEGRLKTLHPLVHGGLLGDVTQPDHMAQMREVGIEPIEVLCVNLYAFEETVLREHTLDQAIESIDIGGPAMIRAAGKNAANVTVVTDPSDYERVLAALRAGEVQALRRQLQAKAFRHTAMYDSMIARYLTTVAGEEPLTDTLTLGYRKHQSLRYGENPHQPAALYVDPLGGRGLAAGSQLWGKELSYNNLLDGDAAWELAADLPAGACAIIKHGNPCGAAAAPTCAESYKLAFQSDPISAFGGIAAFHGVVDRAAAEAMTAKGNFLEVVIGTGFEPEATEIFKGRAGWGQNVRLIEAPLPPESPEPALRGIRGGALVQFSDEEPEGEWKVAGEVQPTDDQWQALRFLWSIVRHVKSNAIVVGTSSRLLGVGAGQMNRVQSVRLALEQAGEGSQGAALASDAFFPFADSIETAAKAGIRAVVEPGGSKKDDEVIAAANALGVAIVFTGVRHFRH